MLVFFLMVLLPPVLGLLVRQSILDQVSHVQDNILPTFNIASLHTQAVRVGWFSSEIQLSASGTLLSVDGKTNSTRTGILYINHGPVIWHLADSLLALAAMQLLPLSTGSEYNPELQQHFSASAIMRLTPTLMMQTRLIAGTYASGGEHWLDLQMSSPLFPAPLLALTALPKTRAGQLWLDLDNKALQAAGMDSEIDYWLVNQHARLSNNRLLFNIRLQ